MAYCSNCGTEISDGAKFCPKCGTASSLEPRSCPQCGTQLSNKANFCPKCGTQCESSRRGENSLGGSSGKRKKWIGYGLLAVLVFIVCFIIGLLGGGKSDISTTPSTEKSIVDKPSVDNSQDEYLEKQRAKEEEEMRRKAAKEEEFRQKAMEYVNQIKDIETSINEIYNNYASFAISNPDMAQYKGVHATGDISNLQYKGDRIWDKLIKLAREYDNHDIINTFKEERKAFDDQAEHMKNNIYKTIYD